MSNLVWFRSDLRIQDNPALSQALKDNHSNIKAIFFITEQQWLLHKWGDNKISFLLAHVFKLQQDLLQLNIQLDILFCDWFREIPEMLLKYVSKHNCTQLFFNKEYELNEQQRDKKVVQLLTGKNVECHSYDDQCLISPGEILNKQNECYSVFTPFKKACYNYLQAQRVSPVSNIKIKRMAKPQGSIESHSAYRKYLNNTALSLWPIGESAAQQYLQDFCEDELLHYKEQRDFPELDATSKLSAYLAVGAISARTCFISAVYVNEGVFPGGNPNIMCWIDELLWRDFYRNIIFHHPRICKSENFNVKYDQLRWKQDPAYFDKWAKGQTGIPIIDAAMRQLVQTGWMHNRLRMITAMFLTKHLLIDWRRGEEFFSKHLVDLDYASNNGGWQWCASTGTDAVPYFRIFNPITQSEKFDPHGNFIRKYCPELKSLTNKQIHNPSEHCTAAQLDKLGYPKVMIDLSKARLQTLAVFKAL